MGRKESNQTNKQTKLRLTVWEEIHLQENKYTLFEVMVTGKVAQYPLHHVTYAAAKFENAKLKSLGDDAFTRTYIL